MAINEWRGDAPAAAQTLTITQPDLTATVRFKIGERYLNGGVTWSSGTASEIATIWNASPIPEFAEITARAGDSGQLILTAKTPGVPFEVQVELDGGAYTTEFQVIRLLNSPTGGTWTLTFDGQTTTGIAYNASASTVQTALEALSNLAPGDVTVVRNAGSQYTVTFAGAYLGVNVPQMIVGYQSLTGGDLSIRVSSIAEGVLPTNEVQRVSLGGNPTGGTFTLGLPGQSAAGIAYNASASAVATALNGVLGSGEVACTGGPLPGTAVDVTFQGSHYGARNLSLLVADGTNLTDGASYLSIASTVTGVAGTNAKFRFTIDADPAIADSGGRTGFQFRFRLDPFGGYYWWTVPLSYESTAAEIQDALEDMIFQMYQTGTPPFLGSGNVTVTGTLDESWNSSGNYLEITFGGHFHSCPITLDLSTGSEFNATNNQNVDAGKTTVVLGAAGTNAVQTLTQTGSGTGTFKLQYGGQTTAPIPYAATASQIEAELVKLSTIGMMGNSGLHPLGHVTASTPNPLSLSQSFRPNVQCAGGPLGSAGVTMTFSGGGLQSGPRTLMTIMEGANSQTSVTIVTEGDPGVAEQQSLELVRPSGSPDPRAGSFTLTYSGQTTGAIAYNANATALQAALEALSNLDVGDVVAVGTLLSGFRVSFRSGLGNVPMLTVTPSLTNCYATISTLHDGGVQFTESMVRSRGPWDASDPANWTLGHVPESGEEVRFQFGSTGPRWGIRWRVPFTLDPLNAYALVCRSDLVDGQRVYVRSTGTLPTGLSANTAYYVQRGSDPRRISLSATLGGTPIALSGGSGTHTVFVKLAGLKTLASWTGWIGTPTINPEGKYREYRPLYWEVDFADASPVVLGEGNAGSGSPLTRLDYGNSSLSPEVVSTAGSRETTLPACLLLGTNNQRLEIMDGSVGVALLTNEVSTINQLVIRGGEVSLGAGVTFPTGAKIDKTSGNLLSLATLDGSILIRG